MTTCDNPLRLESIPKTETDDNTEPVPVDLDKLDRNGRARYREMVVVPQTDSEGIATGLYDVYTPSRSCYLVDAESVGRCDCPDSEFNNPSAGCQHWQRVKLMLERDEVPLPERGEPAGEYFNDYLVAVFDHLWDELMAVETEIDRLEYRREIIRSMIEPTREVADSSGDGDDNTPDGEPLRA
ncbi:hypothetical protein [Natrinema pallidum]|uniref:hypothetical protein n=1 Tax=Natrinema pallidum TaxID=69527 RepID=UPI00375326A1